MKIFKRLILTLILMIAIMLFTVNITKATRNLRQKFLWLLLSFKTGPVKNKEKPPV